jgi:hypothetical protein
MKIELQGKISEFPNRDGIELTFRQYIEKEGIDIKDAWFGEYTNLLFIIYSKFKAKPVKITIESV